MTKEENHLWYDFLKLLPLNFNHQKVLGKYIADFYCASKKIVIELDGSQHYDDENKKYDVLRDQYLKSLGITVLRYSNLDIHNDFDAVCRDILIHLGLNWARMLRILHLIRHLRWHLPLKGKALKRNKFSLLEKFERYFFTIHYYL